MHDIEKGIPCSSSTDISLYVFQACVARLRDIICGISILLEKITKLFEPFTRSLKHPVLPNGYSTLFAIYISQKKRFWIARDIYLHVFIEQLLGKH